MSQIPDRLSRLSILAPVAFWILATTLSVGVPLAVFAVLLRIYLNA
jgi:hypothetical protein